MFVYSVCRPKLVANICINWLPIIVNLSVILGSQYPLNFYYPINVKLGKKERINLIVVVEILKIYFFPRGHGNESCNLAVLRSEFSYL